MAFNDDFNNDYNFNGGYVAEEQSRAFFVTKVLSNAYLFMFLALLVTANVALITVHTGLWQTLLTGGSFMVLLIAQLAIAIASPFAIKKNSLALSGGLFAAYSVLNGILFSTIFMIYSIDSIIVTFFITAGLFGVMAVYGLTTQKDLIQFGPMLLIGLVGIIVASLVNMFIGNAFLDTAISALAIVIFLGLVAYDSQKIRRLAYANPNMNVKVIAMYGAFELYLDFINIFLRLLRFMGKRR